jgi:aspartyl/glutamyl-tRNA(Asn/Gln) amidotransferase C subunit
VKSLTAEGNKSAILDKMARLAKLSLSPQEAISLQTDLQKMIEFVDQIQNFPLTEVEDRSLQAVAPELTRCDSVNDDTRANLQSTNGWTHLPRNFRVKRVVT